MSPQDKVRDALQGCKASSSCHAPPFPANRARSDITEKSFGNSPALLRFTKPPKQHYSNNSCSESEYYYGLWSHIKLSDFVSSFQYPSVARKDIADATCFHWASPALGDKHLSAPLFFHTDILVLRGSARQFKKTPPESKQYLPNQNNNSRIRTTILESEQQFSNQNNSSRKIQNISIKQ